MTNTGGDIERSFQRLFPTLSSQWLLKDEQVGVVDRVLNETHTLCIMPTGSGKSMIYWLSGLMLGGTTIVVSPLIALIDEQADKLRSLGYDVMVLHSGVKQKKQIDLLREYAAGTISPSFIFASPERLATDGLFDTAIRRRRDSVSLFVVDEIHCVSQWGLDFRPFYRQIPRFLDDVWGDTWPKMLGLTATLNARDIRQICDDFRISSSQVHRSALLIRSEIQLIVARFADEETKEAKLWDLLTIHKGQKTLVYLYRKYHKHGVEDLTAKAVEHGFPATHFHGDMSADERAEVISNFKSGATPVVIATNAFGMGIDVPDIRVVIHFMVPESVEQYYQEVGRAARDGDAAIAYLLLTDKNVDFRHKHFIDSSFPTPETIDASYAKITNGTCTDKTLKYFDEEDVQSSLSYLEEFGALAVVGKGVASMQPFHQISSQDVQQLYEATRTKGVIAAASSTGRPIEEVCRVLNEAIIDREVELKGALDKCLLIRGNYSDVPEEIQSAIKDDVEAKRAYRHELLDYLVYVLDTCADSKQLHREIGLYLGVDKHSVDRIYATTQGDLVRSKSEVIIANLLHSSGIEYEYETKIYYDDDKHIEPDFTVKHNGKTWYWEHLGMLGLESYDQNWLRKLEIYQSHFPGMLVTTHEVASLSASAQKMIERLTGTT